MDEFIHAGRRPLRAGSHGGARCAGEFVHAGRLGSGLGGLFLANPVPAAGLVRGVLLRGDPEVEVREAARQVDGGPAAAAPMPLAAAPGGAPALVEQGKGREVIRIRGSLDLDGDKTRELWLGLAYDGGNADRIYIRRDGGYDAVGAWTCGA